MGYKFKTEDYYDSEWLKQQKVLEVDYHDGPNYGMPYWELLDEFDERTMNALKKAQKEGMEYILFTHGSSTSRQGFQTARSVVRNIMRGKRGTPFIIRKKCIDYGSSFLAAIRPAPSKVEDVNK